MSLPLLHAGRTNPGLSAALDLRFALDKSLTAYRGPTPSFSRASTGSYFDGSGVLRYAALNQVLYSEDFGNAAWVKQNGTISTDQIIAPDGKTTADKFTENVANTFFNIYNSSAVSHSAGATMTASGYFKYGTRRYIQFILGPAAAGVSVVVDLLNGLITATGSSGAASYTSSSITNAGNGWYRVSVTGTLPSANTGYYDLFTSNTSSFVNPYPTFSSSGEYTYIWGAQVETGSTVGTYCPTTSSANSAPRLDHTFNGTSWVSRGLLVEEQRTNIVQWSDDLSSASWTKTNCSITADSIISPDGNLNADLAEFSASGTMPRVFQAGGFSVTSGTSYTKSFFVKAGTQRWIQIVWSGGAHSARYANFDTLTMTFGTVSANVTTSVSNVGGGWYRVSATSTATVTALDYFWIYAVDSGTSGWASNSTSGGSIYVYGFQLETGSFPTSYIPTTSASTTRSADVCQITGTDFSGFWNGTEGSLAIEYDQSQYASGANNYAVAALSSGTALMAITSSLYGGSPSTYWQVYNGTAQAEIPFSMIQNGTAFKFAGAYKANDFAATQNGAAVGTDTSGSIPSANQMSIGYFAGYGQYINGHIARLRYFNKRLPNATLQKLST